MFPVPLGGKGARRVCARPCDSQIPQIFQFSCPCHGDDFFALSEGALRISYGHARSARASARCGGKRGVRTRSLQASDPHFTPCPQGGQVLPGTRCYQGAGATRCYQVLPGVTRCYQVPGATRCHQHLYRPRTKTRPSALNGAPGTGFQTSPRPRPDHRVLRGNHRVDSHFQILLRPTYIGTSNR